LSEFRYVFGPVPSRRLGFSLGINNIPYKVCSYSCVYCQLGRTLKYSIERSPYGDPQRIVDEVSKVLSRNVRVDFITFVPDGEPTLDSNLGLIADALKSRFDIPIAILSNSSLIWREDVVEDLMLFDLVSFKVDSVIKSTWRRINRPHGALDIDSILRGIKSFSRIFRGRIISETMLVHEINTSRHELMKIAGFLSDIKPSMAYISIPIRPPAESWVKKPCEDELVAAYAIFSGLLGEKRVELLNLPEPCEFQVHDDPIEFILSTTRVHPLKIDYAMDILVGHGLDAEAIIDRLIAEGKIRIVNYEGEKFVITKIMRQTEQSP